MMAAACARTLSKVGRLVLDTPKCRVSNTVALVPRMTMRCQGRAYGTGGAGFRSRLLLAAPVRGSGRVLGCTFLLGGGFGLYQTIKLTLQRHLAEEKANVNIQLCAIFLDVLHFFDMQLLKVNVIFGLFCSPWFC